MELKKIGKDDKVIDQLDQVTKDSEIKATEIFDKLDIINNHSINILNIATQLNGLIKKSHLKDKEPYFKLINELELNSKDSQDEIVNIMDIMQYQDIHRQKIERVINIVRALNNYMNELFSSSIKDEDRVSSAQYIAGDSKDDVLSDEDIEKMLKEFTN